LTPGSTVRALTLKIRKRAMGTNNKPVGIGSTARDCVAGVSAINGRSCVLPMAFLGMQDADEKVTALF